MHALIYIQVYVFTWNIKRREKNAAANSTCGTGNSDTGTVAISCGMYMYVLCLYVCIQTRLPSAAIS